MAGSTDIAIILKLIADQFQSELRKTSSGLGSFTSGISAGRLGLVGMTAAIVNSVKAYADLGDELLRTSQKIGVTVESLSALKFAAQVGDASFESMVQGLGHLNDHLSQAQGKSDEMATAFTRLGIATKDASGKIRPTQDILLDLADAFSKADDDANKTAYAMLLFGKSGKDLIPFLNNGKAGIQALMAEAKRLGVVMSTDDAKAADEFKDNMVRLNATLDGMTRSIRAGAITGLNDFITTVLHGVDVVKEFSGENLKAKNSVNQLMESMAPGYTDKAREYGGAFDRALNFFTPDTGEAAHKRRIQAEKDAAEKAANTKKGKSLGAVPKPDTIDEAAEAKRATELLKSLYAAMAQAALSANEIIKRANDERLKLWEEDEKRLEIQYAAQGQITGQSERRLLEARTQRQINSLELDRAFYQQQYNTLVKSHEDELEAVKKGLDEEVAAMEKAGQHKKAAARRQEGRTEIRLLEQKNAESEGKAKALIDQTNLEKEMAKRRGQAAVEEINLGVTRSKVNADQQASAQAAAADEVDLQQKRNEGRLTAVQTLTISTQREQQLRQETITHAKQALALMEAGDKGYADAHAAIKQLEVDDERKTAQEKESVRQATNKATVDEAVTVAREELAAAEANLAPYEELARKRLAILDAEHAQEMESFQGTVNEKIAADQRYYAQRERESRRVEDGMVEGLREGLHTYVTDTGTMFNLGVDMARQAAQQMSQMFQSFFFDLFSGKIQTLKNLMLSLLDFVKQVMAQVLAKLAVAKIMDLLATYGASGGFRENAEGTTVDQGGGYVAGPYMHNRGGYIFAPRGFAVGGPVFSNNDSVAAMLTPGEGVLSRRGMANLDRLNSGPMGSDGGGDITVNVINSGNQNKPKVNIRRDMKSMVLDIIFKDVAANGELRSLFGGR